MKNINKKVFYTFILSLILGFINIPLWSYDGKEFWLHYSIMVIIVFFLLILFYFLKSKD